jgi:NTP pyrophosphatase (non-canonical NTP hydrolase)
MSKQPTALYLAEILQSEPGAVADAASAELRRLHSVNTELGAALRRLISYCNTLENRLMEADGEHPAVQEAKEACAKVEGKV